MTDIKRFHVKDGYVLDESPYGSVVRYDQHVEIVAEYEAKLCKLLEQVRITPCHCGVIDAKCARCIILDSND